MPFDTTFFARTDSGSANNPALNLTGAAATEITFVNETDTGAAGDFILDQPSGGGVDPDTQVEINGILYSFTYELSGTMPTTKNNGSQQVPDQLEGEAVVIITVQDYPAPGDETRLSFLPDADPTEAEMNDFGNGAIDIQGIPASEPPNPICFLEGTRIMTPSGPIAIEELGEGDMVMTKNHGAKPILWRDTSTFRWPEADDRHKPILIGAGRLGAGLPERDLIVSPQHRIVLSGPDVVATYGVPAVFVPAKALTALPGVRQMKGKTQANYHHILFREHETIWAEGSLTESFYPGAAALAMLSVSQRTRLKARCFEAVPVADEDSTRHGYGPLAMRALTFQQGREIVGARVFSRSADAIPLAA